MFFMAPRSHTDSKKLAHFGMKLETICNISAGHLQALVIAGIPGATSLWLLCFIEMASFMLLHCHSLARTLSFLMETEFSVARL